MMNKSTEKKDTSASDKSAQSLSLFSRIKRGCWRAFKFFTRSAIYVPLFILLCCATIVGTQLGSRFAVYMANKLIPDLNMVYGNGTINKGLSLSSVHWKMPGIKVDIIKLKIDWQPLCLLQNQLCVKQLSSQKVSVNIDTAKLPNSPDTLDNKTHNTNDEAIITLPLAIQLAQSDLRNIQVTVNDMAFDIKRLKTQAQWTTTGIRVNDINATDWKVNIPLGNPSPSPSSARPLTNKVSTSALDHTQTKNTQSSSTHTTANEWAMAHLPQVFMPIPVFVENLSLNQGSLILGERQDDFKKVTLTGSYQSYLIHIDSFFAQHTDGKINLKGDIQLRENYPIDIQAKGEINQFKAIPALNNQSFNINASQDFSDLQVDLTAKGQTNLSLKGQINLTQPTLDYQVDLKALSIIWPLDTALYQAHDLHFKSEGTLTQQTASLTGNIITPFQPEAFIESDISHKDNTLTIKTFDAKSPMGNITLNGFLSYADDIQWQANVTTEKLDASQIELASLDTDKDKDKDTNYLIPMSQITGSFSTAGKVNLNHKTWQVSINNTDLHGTIDSYPLTLTGDLSINNDFQLSANKLNLTALQSQLTLNGDVTNNWSLNGKLSIPELQLWDPNAAGAINANIRITGEASQPQANTEFAINNISYLDYTLDKANLSGTINLFDNHAFDLKLSADNIDLNALSLTTANVQVKGNSQHQETKITTLGDLALKSQISSDSNLEKKQFNANINQLSLNSILSETKLITPIAISWDGTQQQGTVTPFCLQDAQGKLCVTDKAAFGIQGQFAMNYQGNLGTLITPLLPNQVSWDGLAQLTTQLKWTKDTSPIGRLSLSLSPGSLTLTQLNNRQHTPVEIKYESANFDALLDPKKIQTTLTLTSDNIASINSRLSINIAPDDRQLSGYVKLNQVKLSLIANFFPQLDTLTGDLTSDFTIAGTLSSPTLSGHVTLKEASILTAANPTLIDDLNLKVTLAGQKANINGQWKMGDGTASSQGEIDWSQNRPKARFTLKGSQLSIIQPPLAILKLAPDLVIDIADNTMNVTGELDAPSGEITIVELPEGGVAVSKDVIFQDSIATQEKAANPMIMTANLTMKVGEQLSIEGMGLTGRLTGKLNLKQTEQNQTQLFGEIKIIDGTYKFMGQTLIINTGELQFIGPMDEPSLNIEAVREIKTDDITAGVRITGTPKKPIVTLFSSPAMEQAEILSYILKGTGLEDGNDSLMLTAAFTLSQQAGVGTGTISNLTNTATGLIEKLGFSNVQLDTNDDGKVAISGYIGDKLMVKYGMGVFDTGYEMTVRYYLLSQLYLETVSGALEQSLDLYYNFNL
ncbi:translocation/assembly module TamB domain-containing protein [uncultured Shewanella sp.]|uniref:autotransporter assembly complex protein TamB n=1 Tax=uncultured Shewanella sp. TaxID=173975 RepID=UPI00262BDE1B|nr:translocation/assembly module TamB domain-containing protein [uncultured Shewanella sp.]